MGKDQGSNLRRPRTTNPARSALAQARRGLANGFDGRRYATHLELQDLPHVLCTHKTPLLRPLAGLDRETALRKVTNLRRVVEAIDGLILKPGEAFSFWRLVGRPSLSRGFIEAPGLENGQLTNLVGGGMTQASNLLFWMIAHSRLTLLERWRHAYDAFPDVQRTQPFGSGASVIFNYRDLRVHNATAQTYQLRLWLSPTHLHGALNGSAPEVEAISVEETDHRIQSHKTGSFTRHNKLWRVHENRRELLVENNALLVYRPMLNLS